jgi:hypothetical protein
MERCAIHSMRSHAQFNDAHAGESIDFAMIGFDSKKQFPLASFASRNHAHRNSSLRRCEVPHTDRENSHNTATVHVVFLSSPYHRPIAVMLFSRRLAALPMHRPVCLPYILFMHIVCDLDTHRVRFLRDRAHLARLAAKSYSLPTKRKHAEKRKARRMRAVRDGDGLTLRDLASGRYCGGGFAISYGSP